MLHCCFIIFSDQPAIEIYGLKKYNLPRSTWVSFKGPIGKVEVILFSNLNSLCLNEEFSIGFN